MIDDDFEGEKSVSSPLNQPSVPDSKFVPEGSSDSSDLPLLSAGNPVGEAASLLSSDAGFDNAGEPSDASEEDLQMPGEDLSADEFGDLSDDDFPVADSDFSPSEREALRRRHQRMRRRMIESLAVSLGLSGDDVQDVLIRFDELLPDGDRMSSSQDVVERFSSSFEDMKSRFPKLLFKRRSMSRIDITDVSARFKKDASLEGILDSEEELYRAILVNEHVLGGLMVRASEHEAVRRMLMGELVRRGSLVEQWRHLLPKYTLPIFSMLQVAGADNKSARVNGALFNRVRDAIIDWSGGKITREVLLEAALRTEEEFLSVLKDDYVSRVGERDLHGVDASSGDAFLSFPEEGTRDGSDGADPVVEPFEVSRDRLQKALLIAREEFQELALIDENELFSEEVEQAENYFQRLLLLEALNGGLGPDGQIVFSSMDSLFKHIGMVNSRGGSRHLKSRLEDHIPVSIDGDLRKALEAALGKSLDVSLPENEVDGTAEDSSGDVSEDRPLEVDADIVSDVVAEDTSDEDEHPFSEEAMEKVAGDLLSESKQTPTPTPTPTPSGPSSGASSDVGKPSDMDLFGLLGDRDKDSEASPDIEPEPVSEQESDDVAGSEDEPELHSESVSVLEPESVSEVSADIMREGVSILVPQDIPERLVFDPSWVSPWPKTAAGIDEVRDQLPRSAGLSRSLGSDPFAGWNRTVDGGPFGFMGFRRHFEPANSVRKEGPIDPRELSRMELGDGRWRVSVVPGPSPVLGRSVPLMVPQQSALSWYGRILGMREPDVRDYVSFGNPLQPETITPKGDPKKLADALSGMIGLFLNRMIVANPTHYLADEKHRKERSALAVQHLTRWWIFVLLARHRQSDFDRLFPEDYFLGAEGPDFYIDDAGEANFGTNEVNAHCIIHLDDGVEAAIAAGRERSLGSVHVGPAPR